MIDNAICNAIVLIVKRLLINLTNFFLNIGTKLARQVGYPNTIHHYLVNSVQTSTSVFMNKLVQLKLSTYVALKALSPQVMIIYQNTSSPPNKNLKNLTSCSPGGGECTYNLSL